MCEHSCGPSYDRFGETLESRPGMTKVCNKLPAQRSLVFELVGPAGAGKTSLLKILAQRDKGIRAGLRIPVSRYLAAALLLLPTFLRIHRPYKGFQWREIKRILYLTALHRLLQREASKNYRAIILDEGPVYMLSRLRVFGGEAIESHSFEKWWKGAISEWANTIDAIVWLDAEDPILADRIRARDQPYPVKDISDSSVRKFLARYRAAFNHVIAELTVGDGPKVFKFVTDRESTDQIANKILCL